jgi:hypothetical protein
MDPPNLCPACRRRRLIDLDITLKDGTPLRMRNCPPCHLRYWEHDGQRLAKDEVMALVALHSRRTPTPTVEGVRKPLLDDLAGAGLSSTAGGAPDLAR